MADDISGAVRAAAEQVAQNSAAVERSAPVANEERVPAAAEGHREAARREETVPPSRPEKAEPRLVGDDRVRDEHGRFVAKDGARSEDAPKPAAPVEKTPVQVQPSAPTVEAQKPVFETPPQSLKAHVKEKWKELPPEIKEEFHRLHKETSGYVSRTGPALKELEAYKKAVEPYQWMLSAEGATPHQAVATLMQAAAALRTSPPGTKAQLVANIIRQYAVPVDQLAQVLEGSVPAANQQVPDISSHPEIQELRQFRQELVQQRQAAAMAARQKAEQDIEKFAAEHEFFDEVRQDMAGIYEWKRNQGVDITPEEAYRLAVKLNPSISAVFQQREERAAAEKAAQEAERAKLAASSVKNEPTSAKPQKRGGNSVDDDVRAAVSRLQQAMR